MLDSFVLCQVGDIKIAIAKDICGRNNELGNCIISRNKKSKYLWDFKLSDLRMSGFMLSMEQIIYKTRSTRMSYQSVLQLVDISVDPGMKKNYSFGILLNSVDSGEGVQYKDRLPSIENKRLPSFLNIALFPFYYSLNSNDIVFEMSTEQFKQEILNLF